MFVVGSRRNTLPTSDCECDLVCVFLLLQYVYKCCFHVPYRIFRETYEAGLICVVFGVKAFSRSGMQYNWLMQKGTRPVIRLNIINFVWMLWKSVATARRPGPRGEVPAKVSSGRSELVICDC